MQRWHDCQCEDFPCCGHYDAIPYEPDPNDYADYLSEMDDYDDYDPDTDDEDVIALRGAMREQG